MPFYLSTCLEFLKFGILDISKIKIDILTLFPEMFKGPFDESILRRAQDKLLVEINIHNLRDWAIDKHGTVDDRPYGGGAGMVIKIEPVYKALKALTSQTENSKLQIPNSQQKSKSKLPNQQSQIILLTPQGQVFNQKKARKLSKLDHIILIAGHYEGFDERIREHLVDEEISIGDYVLTGGELPAMVITDAVVRLIPGVLEKPEATKNESFQLTTHNKLPTPLLEHPQHTRPENFKGWKVPKVLLSGNHKEIEEWRKKESVKKTQKRRKDLIKNPKHPEVST